jgi:hypothetical protein
MSLFMYVLYVFMYVYVCIYLCLNMYVPYYQTHLYLQVVEKMDLHTSKLSCHYSTPTTIYVAGAGVDRNPSCIKISRTNEQRGMMYGIMEPIQVHKKGT